MPLTSFIQIALFRPNMASYSCKLAILMMAAIVGVSPGYAKQMTLSCPPFVETKSAAAPLPESWKTGERYPEENTKRAFDIASFSNGDPSGFAFLIPSAEEDVGGIKRDVYVFTVVKEESGAWLICNYEETPHYLAKKLDAVPDRCVVPQDAKADAAAVCE
jgi:hypothetical protein